MIANSQTNRIISIEHEITHQSVIIEKESSYSLKGQDLLALLNQHCPPSNHHINIYHPYHNCFVPITSLLPEGGDIDSCLASANVIFIRYREIQQQELSEESEGDKTNEYRSRQRTILEALKLVKEWRSLHQEKRPNSKRVNLQEAAKLVGVSKKSLDDYYCQLRLAEQHQFDFQANWHQKMGFLRTFVKNHRNEESLRIPRHFKHPRKLQILQRISRDFQGQQPSINIVQANPSLSEEKPSFLSKPSPSPLPESLQDLHQYSNKREGEESIGGSLTPLNVPSLADNNSIFGDVESSNNSFKLMFDLQNGFYGGFQAQFNEPQDPFLKMGRRLSEPESDNPFNGIW